MVYDIVVTVTVVSACWSPKVEKDVGMLSLLVTDVVEVLIARLELKEGFALVVGAVDDASV